MLQYKDKRIKLQTEALGGMKIVKLYGWEDPWFGTQEIKGEAECIVALQTGWSVFEMCFAVADVAAVGTRCMH